MPRLRVTAGFGDILGSVIAIPGIAEKGYADVRIDVASPGGHSSIPPAHTVSVFVNVCICMLLSH
jgi:acetylornithine deacetylase/succinyl-diaminopimelate desuccinylase-like protein